MNFFKSSRKNLFYFIIMNTELKLSKKRHAFRKLTIYHYWRKQLHTIQIYKIWKHTKHDMMCTQMKILNEMKLWNENRKISREPNKIKRFKGFSGRGELELLYTRKL